MYIIQKKNDWLMHFGIPGMHWYERRYQNPDGTLTEAGKRRYGTKYDQYTGRNQYDISSPINKYDRDFVGPREEPYEDVLNRAIKTGEDVSNRVRRERGRFMESDHPEDWADSRNYAKAALTDWLSDNMTRDVLEKRNEFQKTYDIYGNSKDPIKSRILLEEADTLQKEINKTTKMMNNILDQDHALRDGWKPLSGTLDFVESFWDDNGNKRLSGWYKI